MFKVPHSTIRGWLKNKEQIKEAPDSRKRTKFNPKCEIIERIVVEFLHNARECGTTMNGPMLVKLAQMKAKKLCVEGFSSSDGWLSRMKARNNIVAKVFQESPGQQTSK